MILGVRVRKLLRVAQARFLGTQAAGQQARMPVERFFNELPSDTMLNRMIGGSRIARRVLSAGLLGLAFIPLPWSCQTRPRTPASPSPNYLERGDQSFDAGNYPEAAEAYRAYLDANPRGRDADRVLFRLALAYALSESPARDLGRAAEQVERLHRQYPSSPWKPAADFLLRQVTAIEELRADLSQRDARIQELNRELDQVRQVELQRLRADLSRREERIRQLTEEIEKLKQIDMQRRPSAPPR